MYRTDKVTLFIDIGTNAEIVVGNREWLACAACSAGPAFEGGGILHGMRAGAGAIDDFSLDPVTHEPMIMTIMSKPAVGICGSGLLIIIATLYECGIIDRSYIDLDSAMTVGLLPEVDADKCMYVGNGSLMGCRMSELSNHIRRDVVKTLNMMTSFELSDVPSYTDKYVASLFLPHTDETLFPGTAKRRQQMELIKQERAGQA
jgi:uncharacterized 2Fe-2S/4Fe-4S cluster protein (DUF4445 family)